MPFNGITNLRDHNESVRMERWQLEEIKKCANTPLYFIENYVYINTKDQGMQLFKMWDFQKEAIDIMHHSRHSIYRFPRQVGKSSLTRAYLLWYGLFHKDKVVAILANKLASAQEQLQQLRDSYINLPFWFQPGVKTWNKRGIQFSHGTRIICSAASPDNIRGLSINCVVGNSLVTVRDKQTGKIKKISMEELYKDLNEENNIIDIEIFNLKD